MSAYRYHMADDYHHGVQYNNINEGVVDIGYVA